MSDDDVVYRYSGPPSLELSTITAVAPNGATWLQHRLEAQGGAPGAVIVGLSQSRVAFVSVYRPLLGRTVLELPRGFGEQEDTVKEPMPAWEATARREFREETAFELVQPAWLGTFVIDSGLYPQKVHVVTGSAEPSAALTDDNAVEAVRWVRSEDVDALVAEGQLGDAITLAALALWRPQYPTAASA